MANCKSTQSLAARCGYGEVSRASFNWFSFTPVYVGGGECWSPKQLIFLEYFLLWTDSPFVLFY